MNKLGNWIRFIQPKCCDYVEKSPLYGSKTILFERGIPMVYLKAFEAAYRKSKKPVPLRRPLPVESSKSIKNKKPIMAACPFINSFLLVKPNPS